MLTPRLRLNGPYTDPVLPCRARVCCKGLLKSCHSSHGTSHTATGHGMSAATGSWTWGGWSQACSSPSMPVARLPQAPSRPSRNCMISGCCKGALACAWLTRCGDEISRFASCCLPPPPLSRPHSCPHTTKRGAVHSLHLCGNEAGHKTQHLDCLCVGSLNVVFPCHPA